MAQPEAREGDDDSEHEHDPGYYARERDFRSWFTPHNPFTMNLPPEMIGLASHSNVRPPTSRDASAQKVQVQTTRQELPKPEETMPERATGNRAADSQGEEPTGSKRKNREENNTRTEQPKKMPKARDNTSRSQPITILPHMFVPNASTSKWHYPDVNPAMRKRPHKKNHDSLERATICFNNDLNNIAFSEFEKVSVMTLLYQTHTESQKKGDFSSYPACRAMHTTGTMNPTTVDVIAALCLYNLNPLKGWHACSNWGRLLRHLLIHDSAKPEHDNKLDALLTGCGRQRLKPRVAVATPSQAQGKEKPANTFPANNATPIQGENREFHEFMQKVTTDTTMDNRARMIFLQEEMKLRGWQEEAEYAAKMTDEKISRYDRETIRRKVIRHLDAKLRGQSGDLLPKHYTIKCNNCEQHRTF
ncbi:hypothetical protein CMEL01_16729 [Colletotrichum melonis]|uniref:Uncharacterized protein n=1 Tax=Colletotrichum melonis TaxID=1209925 RepID=A0AAI9U9U7_9PEZI|nr:hypothetical protein CMEL01_16729 [Colletotrichum melonis]